DLRGSLHDAALCHRHRTRKRRPTFSRRSLMGTNKIQSLLFAGAMSASIAAQSQTLVVYSAYETGQMRPLVQAFEKANPGIKVEHFRQPGEELLATLELELRARSPKADVVGLNDASLSYLQRKHGALEPYAAKDADKIRMEVRDRQNLITPAFINIYLIHYNT